MIILVVLCTEIMTSQPLYQNAYQNAFQEDLQLANFADIIEISTMFIKKTFKGSKKVKRIRNCVQMRYISVFLGIPKFADF